MEIGVSSQEFQVLGWKRSELILVLKGLFIMAKEHSFEVWKYRGHLSIRRSKD